MKPNRKKNGHHPQAVEWFDAFYYDYPKHEGKQAAFKAFVKLDLSKDLLRAISADLHRRAEDGTWEPDNPDRYKFIPLPATYLNGRRWEDGNA